MIVARALLLTDTLLFPRGLSAAEVLSSQAQARPAGSERLLAPPP